jgi:hypothetical protein
MVLGCLFPCLRSVSIWAMRHESTVASLRLRVPFLPMLVCTVPESNDLVKQDKEFFLLLGSEG